MGSVCLSIDLVDKVGVLAYVLYSDWGRVGEPDLYCIWVGGGVLLLLCLKGFEKNCPGLTLPLVISLVLVST